MKISVAIATYNGEKYIIEQLKSILTQTRKVDEVIITDDISTDQTVNVVNAFIKDNHLTESWKIIVNKKTLGYAENFRKCMDLTTGDIIFPCDQDDIWEIDKVEKMSDAIEKNDQIGVLCSAYSTFNDGESITYNKCASKESISLIPLNCHNRFLRSLGSVMAVRQQFYQETKQYWYNGWAQDEYLWCIAVLFNKCYKTSFFSTKRRIHSEQFSGHKFNTKAKRVQYLEREVVCAEYLLKLASLSENKKAYKLYKNNLKTTKLRLDLVKNKRLRNIFILPFYLKYYYSKKSYLIEIKIALKG